MPVIYYSSSGRAREGTGSQGPGSREGRGGLPSRSVSSRSTYIGGNRNGGASRTGLGINRRNSSSAVEGGSGTGDGAGSGEDPEPTDADDSIFLSDLVRTGEASRLRRRGAMRLDHYHREGPQTTSTPNENPSTRTEPTGSLSRGNTLRNTESLLSVLRTNASISRTGSARLDTSSGRFEGDLWVPPTALRRPSTNIVTPRSNADSLNNDSESYTYTLFCGYEPEPGTEEYAAYEERWAQEDFVRKQMCSEAFTPSPFPIPPTSSISSKGKAKATPSPPLRSNGCGALLHLHAAPRSELGVWTANTEATEAVVPLDPEYFVDSSSDAPGRSRGGSSRTLESRLGSAMVKVNIVKSACGCVREGVGCAACGNPLGTLYKPCRTAAESIFSNTRSSRTRRPGNINAETLASGVRQSSWTTGRPDGPQGPAYWRSTSSVSQLHPDSPSSSSPSVQTSSSSTPSKSPDHPYCIYTFFSSAVSSSPKLSSSSSRNNASSSRPSASRNTSNVSNASSDSNSSSVTTRPTVFMHRINRPLPTPSSPSPLTATSPYVLVPPLTSDVPSITPTPSSGVIAPVLNIATVSVSMPPEANRVVAVEASGDRGADRDNYDEGREIRNRSSIVSLASTVTVVSEDDAEDRTVNNTREGDGEFEEDRAALHVGDGQPLDSLPPALSAVSLGDNPSSSSSVLPETVSDRPASPLTPTRLFPNFPSRAPDVESRTQYVPSVEEVRRRGGRPIPRRRARIGEDEAEAALRRVYGDRDSNEMLLHMLTGDFTLVEEEEEEGASPQPSATSRTEVDMQEPGERTAVENMGTGVNATVDGTPRAAAAVNSIPLEQESRSIPMNLNAPSANSVTSLESATTSGPQLVVDSSGLSDFTAPVSLTAPLRTSASLHHMLEPNVMRSVSENIESVELTAGAELTRQGSQAHVVDNGSAHATDLDMDTVHTEHVLALIRRAREQAQERREVMLDLLMGATPYIRSGTGDGVNNNNNNNNHNTRSSSVPSSPSSTASSLPPLVFPPTPTSPSLPASPASPIRSPEAISRLTDLIRNVRVVAETTGMERQPEWAFEEWMSALEENRAHGETDQTGEAVSHRRSEDVSRDDLELDSDTESELEGRIMFRQTRRSDWLPRESDDRSGLRLGVRQHRSRELEADDDEVEEDSWSLPSMPALQDVSDSEDDGIPGVWEDSSDDDERSDIAGADREESSRRSNRAFDSNGELLGTLEEDVDKPSEAGRARMGVRVPSNIVAGR